MAKFAQYRPAVTKYRRKIKDGVSGGGKGPMRKRRAYFERDGKAVASEWKGDGMGR